jgi:hypothetical protein
MLLMFFWPATNNSLLFYIYSYYIDVYIYIIVHSLFIKIWQSSISRYAGECKDSSMDYSNLRTGHFDLSYVNHVFFLRQY